MTKQQKITLSASRDIPFNKLMLSQSNVRHVKAGVSIEELAEDMLQPWRRFLTATGHFRSHLLLTIGAKPRSLPTDQLRTNCSLTAH